MNRIKYYSINDLLNGRNLRKCKALLHEYDDNRREVQGINDMIELYNIKKYFDNKVYLVDWTADIITNLETIISKHFGIVARFIKTINNDNLLRTYNEIERIYKDDFWELIDKFKAYENVTFDYFQEFLSTTNVLLRELLKCKNITNHYGEIIRDKMLYDSSSAELLLDKYELKHLREPQPMYFPKELTNSNKETIITNYLDSEEPNLNYVRLIASIQSSKDKLEISAKTLLKAKRKAEELEKHYFEENAGMPIETSVSFSKKQDEEVKLTFEGQIISASYSSKWIEENSDFPTLLNNFIYLFEFVDLQMRSMLVNKISEMGVFERYIFTSSQNAYTIGCAFERKNILSLLQMSGYYHQLFSIGIRLEEVIEWFFEEYLLAEFDAHNFKVKMPSTNSLFLEKCTNIMPALESVLKQFILFVEEGHIDFELLEIRSEHLIYRNIPSLVNKKYVYGLGDEFNYLMYLFFSDQSSLGYYEKSDKSYTNFFELLTEEKLILSEIEDYNVTKVEWLIEHEYLKIDEDGYIVFKDEHLVLLLYDFYMNEVVCYWKCSEYKRKLIDGLERRNVIEFESSLFSRQEVDYINYTLNKSQFNNGLDLRNKYSHTQPNIADDEGIHNENYLIFLRLFILAVIKINDDFCTRKELGAARKLFKEGPNIT
ncbi:hypothetical protein [Paenibacillus sp. B1-33]|uniref:hypothetical protein n=1 Tax=unclassified Paenibacillus TaxID=185978 RepID=UPI003D2BB568